MRDRSHYRSECTRYLFNLGKTISFFFVTITINTTAATHTPQAELAHNTNTTTQDV